MLYLLDLNVIQTIDLKYLFYPMQISIVLFFYFLIDPLKENLLIQFSESDDSLQLFRILIIFISLLPPKDC